MDDRKTVWCGNLSEKVTEEILYELFLQAGPLERVNIPKDKHGKQRTFGFVTFKHECSVPYSLSLFKGTCLYKRPLNLQSRAHNTNTDTVQQGFGAANSEGSERQRTQSLPINFGSTTPAPQDYDMLLQLGQQMLLPGIMGGYNQFCSPVSMYASQMNSSQFLGGQFHDMRTPKSSRDSYGFSRNHPYNRGGGGGGEHNHSSNGRHNKPNTNNSLHRRDTPRSSDKRRH